MIRPEASIAFKSLEDGEWWNLPNSSYGNSHMLVGFDLDAKLVQKMPQKLEDALGEHREHRADQADSFKA